MLGYGDYATRPGLTLLCTPGNDVESTTGMAGAGAHIQLFSTGLGTPTGNPVSPVVKVSSNTILSRKIEKDIIDVDAGTIITGDETVEEVGKKSWNRHHRAGQWSVPDQGNAIGSGRFYLLENRRFPVNEGWHTSGGFFSQKVLPII